LRSDATGKPAIRIFSTAFSTNLTRYVDDAPGIGAIPRW
jgi:hypothetical protein